MLYNLIILNNDVPRELLKDTLLKYLNDFEKDEVADVFYFMIDLYKKKKLYRANGYPAQIHPVEVAKIVDFNAHLMKVALLHDVLEDIPDTDFEKKQLMITIKHKFGKEVLNAVTELTNPGGEYAKYISSIKRRDAIIVKEADMLTNVRSCTTKKLNYMKYKLPVKVKIFLNHLNTIKPRDITLFVHAFYKYYAKIIEELFRAYESQIKNLKEQHKTFAPEIKYLEKQLSSLYLQYSVVRKNIYKKFVQGLVSQHLEAKNHLKIELLKRTKEALTSQMPLNSILISINQNMYLYEKTRDLEPQLANNLLLAIEQQIKFAKLESFRLQHHYDIIIQNSKLLSNEFIDEIENPLSKIRTIEKTAKKINEYNNWVTEWQSL